MRPSRLNRRTVLLLLAEATLIFGSIVGAVYLRTADATGAAFELISKHGYWKAALVTVFCLTAFYLFDLYDFVVMHDRRELVLRLVQALGLAWVGLALAFYAYPPLMLGRSISVIALPLALAILYQDYRFAFADLFLKRVSGLG